VFRVQDKARNRGSEHNPHTSVYHLNAAGFRRHTASTGPLVNQIRNVPGFEQLGDALDESMSFGLAAMFSLGVRNKLHLSSDVDRSQISA